MNRFSILFFCLVLLALSGCTPVKKTLPVLEVYPDSTYQTKTKHADGKTKKIRLGSVVYPGKSSPQRIEFLSAFGDSGKIDAGRHFINFLAVNAEAKQSIMKPYGIAFGRKKLYLCDTKMSSLWVLDIEHRIKRRIKPTKEMGGKLVNITLDSKTSKAYIVDMGKSRMLVYSKRNKRFKAYYKFGTPIDVAVYQNKVYILDKKDTTVKIWNNKLTELLATVGKAGHGDGEFFKPSGITVDNHGFLYVADTGNSRVQKFDPKGKFLISIGKLGDTPGCFVRPKGVAVDHTGNIYVTDAMLENVQLFDPNGKLLLYFGKLPVKELDLKMPAKIIIDYEHIDYFKNSVDSAFKLEYLILVSNQIGANKVNIYGFCRKRA